MGGAPVFRLRRYFGTSWNGSTASPLFEVCRRIWGLKASVGGLEAYHCRVRTSSIILSSCCKTGPCSSILYVPHEKTCTNLRSTPRKHYSTVSICIDDSQEPFLFSSAFFSDRDFKCISCSLRGKLASQQEGIKKRRFQRKGQPKPEAFEVCICQEDVWQQRCCRC